MKEKVDIILVSTANDGWCEHHEKSNIEGHSGEVYVNLSSINRVFPLKKLR